MRALYVHGMGRSPISGIPMRIRLLQHGYRFDHFNYMVSFETFEQIRQRLVQKLCTVAARGDYVVVGHSLGGVLLRAALASLPAGTRMPQRLFLLGSPTSPSRLAKNLQKRWLFRALSGDCGQLLASDHRMQQIPTPSIPTTAVIGIRGVKGKWTPFGEEENDGIVAASESRADWADEVVKVPVIHALQPSSWLVADVIVGKLDELSLAARA